MRAWDEEHRLTHDLWIDAISPMTTELYITANSRELRLRNCLGDLDCAIANLRNED